jgi:hypothetical protein
LGKNRSISDSPVQHVTNDVMNSITMVMKNQSSTKSLLTMLTNIDPAAVEAVTAMVQALLDESQTDLANLQNNVGTANQAFTDAENAYNAAVAEKVRLDDEMTSLAADIAHQEGVVNTARDAHIVATGAKTNAQSTLDTESIRLNHEIATLTQVIELLNKLSLRDWVEFEGKHYLYDATLRTFADARQFCQSRGGDLASIHSLAENNFVTSIGHGQTLFIGGQDLVGDNAAYTWSDGSAWDYSKWYPNEPNGNAEQCVNLYAQHDGQWNDLGCTATLASVCKHSS